MDPSGLELGDRRATWIGALAILWTAADLIVSEPALATFHEMPYLELVLTLGFLAIVVAARFRHVALARVGARPTRPAGQRERRAS